MNSVGLATAEKGKKNPKYSPKRAEISLMDSKQLLVNGI